jgi:hypothetical protein
MYGMIALKKHVDNAHVIIVQKFEEVNALVRGSIEKKKKKRLYVLGNARFKFFFTFRKQFSYEILLELVEKMKQYIFYQNWEII